MSPPNGESIANQILETYADDEKIVSLTLAVIYWGMISQNPKSTPPDQGKIIELANKFHHWIV